MWCWSDHVVLGLAEFEYEAFAACIAKLPRAKGDVNRVLRVALKHTEWTKRPGNAWCRWRGLYCVWRWTLCSAAVWVFVCRITFICGVFCHWLYSCDACTLSSNKFSFLTLKICCLPSLIIIGYCKRNFRIGEVFVCVNPIQKYFILPWATYSRPKGFILHENIFLRNRHIAFVNVSSILQT